MEGNTTLASVLTDIGSVFESLTGYVGDVCEIIIGNPLLLLGVAIPFAFAIVKFVKRMF